MPDAGILAINRATESLAPRLTEIARAAKAHWRYPSAWLEEWRDELSVSEGAIRQGTCYVARIDEDIAGFYLLEGTGAKRTLEHLWIDPEFIGKGLGTALFAHAVSLAAEDGAHAVEIVSDPNAQGFYERLGAEKVGESVGEVLGERRVLPVLRVSHDVFADRGFNARAKGPIPDGDRNFFHN